MDPVQLVHECLLSDRNKSPGNPFILRPWLYDKSSANSNSDNVRIKGIVAGGLTGGIEMCITYPFNYVKMQLQLDGKAGAGKQYSGIWDVVTKTVKNRGIFGLYRGLTVVISGAIAKVSVRFGAFESIKKQFLNSDGKLSPEKRFFAGLSAGLCEAILVVTPADTINVKIVNDQRSPNPRFRGIIHGVRTIIQENGLRGVYQGLGPTMIKQGSNQAIRFFVVETLKDWYSGDDKSKVVPKPIVGLFGAFAGGVSVLGNTPIDVIKTRMQGLEAAKYKNSLDCAVQMWRAEGPRAFYKGTIPRLSRVCLEVSITFMIYDTLFDIFNVMWP